MLRPITPFVEYYINYDYITEKLCENRNKPILACNGKCYLNEQVQKFIDIDPVEQEKTPMLTVELEKYPISTVSLFSYKLLRDDFVIKRIQGYTNLIPQEYLSEVFHPPSA